MPLVLTVLSGCSNWINKTMQAVAVEPAVALEALPPATFDCIGLHHKEEQGGEIPKKTYFHQLHTGRSREENRRKNIFH